MLVCVTEALGNANASLDSLEMPVKEVNNEVIILFFHVNFQVSAPMGVLVMVLVGQFGTFLCTMGWESLTQIGTRTQSQCVIVMNDISELIALCVRYFDCLPFHF